MAGESLETWSEAIRHACQTHLYLVIYEQQIIRMEKQGGLRKTKGLERKNIVRITLTDKGEEALRQAMKRETIVKVMSYLSDKEQDCLRAHLETLRYGALEEYTRSLRGKTPDTYTVSPKLI